MQRTDTKTQAHFFICCRQKDEGKACCAEKGAQQLLQDLKTWVKEEKLKPHIRVSSSSCLGHCEKGITAVLYPQNQWFTDISLQDIEEIKKQLKQQKLP